ncbi:hypothetical protein [Crucivirus-483]|nr:hypothetical protein [Crucivirus-483]
MKLAENLLKKKKKKKKPRGGKKKKKKKKCAERGLNPGLVALVSHYDDPLPLGHQCIVTINLYKHSFIRRHVRILILVTNTCVSNDFRILNRHPQSQRQMKRQLERYYYHFITLCYTYIYIIEKKLKR